MARDPRSEAEKARADLARNAELGMAVPESPLEEGPSVTPRTFGDSSEAARVQVSRSGRRGGWGTAAIGRTARNFARRRREGQNRRTPAGGRFGFAFAGEGRPEA